MEDNRSHAAPFRPLAAAAASTHHYAVPNIHQPLCAHACSDAGGLYSGYLHGSFYGERFAECSYYPAANGEQLRGPVPSTTAGYTQDVLAEGQRLNTNILSSILGLGGHAHDDNFAFYGESDGEPRRSTAGHARGTSNGFAVHQQRAVPYTTAGYAQDVLAEGQGPNTNTLSATIPYFMCNPNISYTTGHALGAGFAFNGDPRSGTAGHAHAATGDGFTFQGEQRHGAGFAFNGEPRRGAAGHVHAATGDVFAFHGEPRHGAGFAFNGEPRSGTAGHAHAATGDGFTFQGEPRHGAGFAFNGEPRSGTAGHAHAATGDGFTFQGEPRHGAGFAFNGEPRRGAAGHVHAATGDVFAFHGEPLRAGGGGHAQDRTGDGFASDSDRGFFSNANCAASCTVQSVWRNNYAEVFDHVVASLLQPRRHLHIALDLEFVADASTNVHYRPRPISWIDYYKQLRTFVNGGDVIQVGLVFAFELEDHHGAAHQAPSPVIALEINLEFDEDARLYNGASISFLEKQGHRLAEHKDRGVTAEQFINGLLRHLVSGGHDDPITWIMYHGDYDLGFLMRLLQEQQQQGRGRGALPSDRATFMREVRRQFPIFYDLRVLGQLVREGFSGKFSVLAELLGVQRIGDEHHAGSDALLTMSCFSEILRRSQHELHRLDSRKCLLSGMEELDMAIKCGRHIDDSTVQTVDVQKDNFNKHARWIQELVTSNFRIVGVDVSLPRLGNHLCSAAEEKDYDMMKSSLEGIGEFQVAIGFMNAEGMLALGRVWKFYLSFRVLEGDEKGFVHPTRLASLMKSCGATHNPNVAWVTYQGSHGIACLMKSFLEADDLDLPSLCCSYIERQSAYFPALYDVGLIAQRCPDIGVLPTGCAGGLSDTASNLKVVLVLRCYKRLEESPHFPLIASAVKGQVMARPS